MDTTQNSKQNSTQKVTELKTRPGRAQDSTAYLKDPRNFFSVCAVYIRLGDRTNMEEFTEEERRMKSVRKRHVAREKNCTIDNSQYNLFIKHALLVHVDH